MMSDGGTTRVVPILFLLSLVTIACTDCPAGFFACSNGNCIKDSRHCDGNKDCSDGSDETDCEKFRCHPPLYLLCDNQNCVESLFRCDGEDDCGDWSDEKGCGTLDHSPALCNSNQFKCSDDSCIPSEWVCDGRDDCPDRLDETKGCSDRSYCSDGFLCASHHCIAKEFHCDGVDDCGDGSDETSCILLPPMSMNLCTLDRGLFACPDKKKCLTLDEVCDGIQHCLDGSDEGPMCVKSKALCPNYGCSYKCVPTPVKPLCVCPPGFTLDEEQKYCKDNDECKTFGVCSQKCKNTKGSFQCYCDEGYNLQGDNHTCLANGGTPVLLFSTKTEIRAYFLSSEKSMYTSIAQNQEHISGVDFDGVHIFWTRVLDGEEAIMRSNNDGSDVEVLVTSGLSLPEDLAIDWATSNIYFTDGEESFIGVCSPLGKECTAIVNEDVAKPRGIALMVTKGQMFWSDWGSNAMIATSGMDGSNPKPFVKDVHWPNGIALDMGNDRLYWVDSKAMTIESVKLDGSDRRVVLEGIVKHPYSIAVFEDDLYWSDWEGRQILSCHKFNGKSHKTLIRSRKNQIYGIKIYHGALRPKVKNPCESAPCSDLCLLAPNATYICACPPNKEIGVDKHTCTTILKRQMIIAASDHRVIEVEHQILGRQFYTLMLPNQIKLINGMAYNTIDDLLILSDGEQKKIFTMNVNTLSLRPLITNGIGRIVGLDFDYLGNNLYWCDGEKYSVEVFNFNTGTRKIILRNMVEIPVAIAVIPEEGLIYMAFIGSSSVSNAHIDAIFMDGSGKRIHVVEKGMEGPDISLWYDYDLHRVFWSDSGSRSIRSVAVDGTDYRVFRTLYESPMSVASLGQDVFWTVWESNYLYWSNKFYGDGKVKRVMLDIGERVETIKLTAMRGVFSTPSHECHNNNGDCSHLCLLQGKHHVCGCPDDMQLGRDNKTCATPLHCSKNEVFCPKDNMCIQISKSCDGIPDCPSGEDEVNCNKCKKHEFQCHNGHCIEEDMKCDGEAQCTDYSDEQFCDTCTTDQFHCESGECINKQWHCDRTMDCSDGSDEKDCDSVECNSDEFKCKSGSCIPADWECDGEINCVDSSDEHKDCPATTCSSQEFTCLNGNCIDVQLICNGNDDCGDDSDEKHCDVTPTKQTSHCNDKEFKCTSQPSICVAQDLRCDGNPDCPKGEDEINCGCDPTEFECRNGRCISNDWLCDGANDCGDSSDEAPKKCFHSTEVPACDGYLCRTGKCLPVAKVCDKRPDCEDGSDEGGKCDIACTDNPCDGTCQPTPLGYQCVCEQGFTLLGDSKSCGDVNECKSNVCSQICLNTLGSFRCECVPGYTLRLDKKSCKAKGPPLQYVYMTQGGQIRKVARGLNVIDVVFKHPFIKISGLDTDTRRMDIYWTMQETNSIHRKSLATRNITFVEGIGRPTGISVDWITRNIYYIDEDSEMHYIKICNLEQRVCATIIYGEIGYKITSLIVDPLSGYLFWTDASLHFDKPESRLHKAELSGLEQTILTESKIGYVSSLAIDPIKRKVYWSDKTNQAIGSITYDGKDQLVVFTGEVRHPTGLTFFEDSLYWIMDGTGLVTKCLVFGKAQRCETIHLNVYDADFFNILQTNRQIDGHNSCATNSCKHMCVLGPHGSSCICADGKVVDMGEQCKIQDVTSPKFGGSTATIRQESKQKGSWSVVTGLLICILIVALLGVGYYVYKKYFISKGKLDIRIRFQNPAFGFPHSVSQTEHLKQVIPGEHEYVNPLQMTQNLKVTKDEHEALKTPHRILKKIRAPSPPIEEEELESDFPADAPYDIKTRLIP